ncbi:MAG: RluA family pseudouridine synthase [Alphaproteobacteria bacterium]|nr:RluA family pseudouridine synthase [Alphaproteobacteria bacterium]
MKKNYPSLTLSHLQKLCRKGEIRINGSRTSATASMTCGDEVKLPPYIVEYEKTPDVIVKKDAKYTREDIDNILKTIIYEDDEIFVLNKPAGLATQGGSGITKHIDSLINIALPEYNGNLRLTHRIDKETSGILVIAKNYDSALKITTLFKEQKIHKTYHALVYGNFDDKKKEGIIKEPIIDMTSKVNEKGEHEAKFALTQYKVLDEAFGMLSLVEFKPKTGRMHQLRIHSSHIGHPIIGDFKYGKGDEFAKLKDSFEIEIPRKLYLHAYMIEIEGKPIIKAEYPTHFKKICKYLNF